jgi:GNAT superfamily N-acetyltransferase
MPNFRTATSRDGMNVARHRYFRLDARRDDLNAYSAWIEEHIEAGTYLGFFAESHGQVVAGCGALILNLGPSRGNRQPLQARLVNLFTAENWRRQGLAFELSTRALQACRVQGINQFGVSATNETRKLLEKLGFELASLEMTLTDESDRFGIGTVF